MATAAPESQPRTGTPGNLLVVALVLVLAWQAAYWTWVFVAPPPVAAAAASQPAIDLAAVARLFGASAPTDAPRSASGLKLKGVIAPTPGTEASAIFSTGAGRDIAVYIDGEVQPGMKLAEVHPDHVIVSSAGVKSRIDLEAARSTGVATRGGLPGKATGFKLNVARTGSNNYSISRKELDDALPRSRPANFLGRIGVPPKGGVRMESPPPEASPEAGPAARRVIKKVKGKRCLRRRPRPPLHTSSTRSRSSRPRSSAANPPFSCRTRFNPSSRSTPPTPPTRLSRLVCYAGRTGRTSRGSRGSRPGRKVDCGLESAQNVPLNQCESFNT